MNKIYCSNTSCAKVTHYEAAKPKFCAHCGEPFSGGFNFAIAQTQPAAKKVAAQPQSRPAFTFQLSTRDEETDDNDIAELGEFKIGVANIGKKVTLRDIQSNGAFVADSDRPVGNMTDPKQAQLEIRRKFIKQSPEASTEVGE